MIRTILRIGFINVRRDRVVQVMTFVLPIMFFSIFALVFGQQRDPTRRIPVAIVDEDGSDFSTAIARAFAAEGGLNVRTARTADSLPLTRADAETLVRGGTVPVAVVLPQGLGAHASPFSGDTTGPRVQLLADVSDPIAPQVVQGLLQKVSFTAAPGTVAAQGMALFERFGGPLTRRQQQSRETFLRGLASNGPDGPAGTRGLTGLRTEVIDIMHPRASNGSTVAFYAAGIGVMFLLFSASGASGTLLDEQDSGTLDRLIGSRGGMTGVLAGKWLFLTLMGCLQLTVMFTWGMVVFQLPLLSHIPGFVVMTVCTAGAAAAFGLLLATLSRTRAQLAGVTTILVLAMSALGGSMFPRFLMSETMQTIGLVTFNAWALDGYIKVFWRSAPVTALGPQVGVLLAIGTVFMLLARRMARRWEAS